MGGAPDSPRRVGRPPRTDLERAAHRSRLVIGCMEGIRTHGPDLSMEQMAEAAGVSKPVIYAEFGGRNGVAEQLAAELGERIEREVTAAVLQGDSHDYQAGVRVFVDALFDLVSGEPAVYAFMVRSLRSSGSGLLDNALVASISDRLGRLWGIVGVELDPDVQRVSTHAVLGLVFATLDSWQLTRRPPRSVVVDLLATFLARGTEMVLEGEMPLPRLPLARPLRARPVDD